MYYRDREGKENNSEEERKFEDERDRREYEMNRAIARQLKKHNPVEQNLITPTLVAAATSGALEQKESEIYDRKRMLQQRILMNEWEEQYLRSLELIHERLLREEREQEMLMQEQIRQQQLREMQERMQQEREERVINSNIANIFNQFQQQQREQPQPIIPINANAIDIGELEMRMMQENSEGEGFEKKKKKKTKKKRKTKKKKTKKKRKTKMKKKRKK